jgi:hypothetical protein
MGRRLAGGLFILPAMLALAVAGCGKSEEGSGVATAGGAAGARPTASASAASLSDDERRLKFAQCMRENGVDMPDPEPGEGGVKVRLGGDIDPAKAQAAMEKCRSYLPNGGQPRKLDPQQVENMRKLAQCMRENGVPEFPDPQPDGTMKIDASMFGGKGPDDPTFKAAMEKCQQYAPKMGGTATGRAK